MSQPSATVQRPADASTCVLPPGPWHHLLDGLCARFPTVARIIWQQRLAQGRVLDHQLQPLAAGSPYRPGMQIYYFREVPNERPVPYREQILYQDDHLWQRRWCADRRRMTHDGSAAGMSDKRRFGRKRP